MKGRSAILSVPTRSSLDSGAASQEDEEEEEDEESSISKSEERSGEPAVSDLNTDGEDENSSSSSDVHGLQAEEKHHSRGDCDPGEEEDTAGEEEDSADLSLDSRLIEARCMRSRSGQGPEEECASALSLVSSSNKNRMFYDEKFYERDRTSGGEEKGENGDGEGKNPVDKDIENDVVITELDGLISEMRAGLDKEEAGVTGPEDNLYRKECVQQPPQLDDIQEDVEDEGQEAVVADREDELLRRDSMLVMEEIKNEVLDDEDIPRSEPAPSCLHVEDMLPHLNSWASESGPAERPEEAGTRITGETGNDPENVDQGKTVEEPEIQATIIKEYDRREYESDRPALTPKSVDIQMAIARIEQEESKEAAPPSVETSLTDEELNNLRKKCMQRWKTNSEQPLPVQPPLVKDFSNSAKLIRFLEETQERDEKTSQSVKIVAHRINSNLPRLSDLLGRPVAELAEELLSLKLELEAEGRTVAVLRAGLDQSQQVMEESVARLQKENRQRQESQRRQYGEAINRHQTFIDQLIEDKKVISQKCETLAVELRTLERRSKENISALESRHSLEINRLKHMNESSDKLKRERWMDQKARKIKEQTVRSLEGEVEKIMKKHTQELAELRGSAKQQMEEQEQALRHTYTKTFDQYRVQAEREKKEVIEQEKLFQMEKFRKQAEQIETFHRCEVQQLREELERERRKQEEERERWMREADQIRRIAKEKCETEVEAVKDEMEDMKKALKRRHANELITLKANEESDRKEFERKLMENFDKMWTEKEIELRANFSRERDMEIDRVIERLEFEMKKAREDSERSHEERLSRLKLKHDRDLTEIVKELEEVKEKAAKARDKQLKTEEENTLLQSVNHKLEVRVSEVEETRLRLMEERKDLNTVIRKEFSKNLDRLSEENSKLAEEINTMVVKHKSELFLKEQAVGRLRQDFEEEMQALHDKVAETMRKKDKMLEEMREQHEVAVKKIDQLEMIIGQQGKSMFAATSATKSKQK